MSPAFERRAASLAHLAEAEEALACSFFYMRDGREFGTLASSEADERLLEWSKRWNERDRREEIETQR